VAPIVAPVKRARLCVAGIEKAAPAGLAAGGRGHSLKGLTLRRRPSIFLYADAMHMYFPFDPCPCGSKRKALTCCLGEQSYFREPAQIARPRLLTNFSHERCFLSFWGDCSPLMSGEHYFSEGVIRATKPRALARERTVNITYPKLFEGTREIGIASLTANILCRSHNQMFSPLDAAAEQLWSAMRDLAYDPLSYPWSRLLNGHDIERWMLKTLLTSFHGPYGTQSTGETLRLPAPTTELSEKILDISKWDNNSGVYIDSVPLAREQKPFAFTCVYRDSLIVAAEFHMFGIRMIFLPCSVDDPTVITASARHRPDGLAFRIGNHTKFIAFSWNHRRRPSGTEDWVRLDLAKLPEAEAAATFS
jgi:hypothetical protein